MTTDPRFIACLFEPDDLVEIRLLPEKNRHFVKVSKITTLDDQLTRSNADGQNVYIGANPRRREAGKAKDIPLARCVLVDLDQIDPDKGLLRIEEAGLPAPTCTVASGHGIHAYWRLIEPMLDLEAWRATQKSLIALLGSDPAIQDPPRLMRVPGFTNHKDPVADCRVLDADPARRYEISELLVEDENLLLQSRQSLTSDCSAYSVTSACSATVDEVIRLTLPPRLGTRNAFILRLARGLKFEAGLGTQTFTELKPIVREWHAQALPNIRTKEFDQVWSDFIRAWKVAVCPLFEDVVVQAFSRASQKAADDLLPPSAAEFDSKPVKLIIGLCAELAALNGDQKRFFLSGHVAAKLLKSYPKQVYGWLGMLVVEGVIEVVKKGNQRRATRYRYTGEL